MSSIFTQIINNEISSFKVLEDKNYLAFLDTFPIAYGHVLVVPKNESEYLFDIESEEYLGLWKFTQRVAKAMDKVLDCQRIGVSVIGLEVPHVHVHLVPINNIKDLNFENPKKKFSNEQMRSIAEKINNELS